MAAEPAEPADLPPLLEFASIIRRLRAECAWKREQTHRSLQRYLLEETYETLEAIDVGEFTGVWTDLREELGDLLLQVYFHAVIAEELGEFTLDEVATDISAKMVRRNPHVFQSAASGSDPTGETDGPTEIDAAEVDAAWQRIKSTEKPRSGVTDGLPAQLPALMYALKVAERLDHLGRWCPPEGDGLGERLWALVDEARRAGLDPEQELRDAVRAVTSTEP